MSCNQSGLALKKEKDLLEFLLLFLGFLTSSSFHAVIIPGHCKHDQAWGGGNRGAGDRRHGRGLGCLG
jgi:hypothetical protein